MSKRTQKLEVGSIYAKNGTYYYRYQVNGQRKAVCLQTKNFEEAMKAATEYVPVVKATGKEVIGAHILEARGLIEREKNLLLSEAWDYYSKHPQRALPATVHERNCYHATLQELVVFLNNPNGRVRDVSIKGANSFADAMRQTQISVETHNRKLTRLRKIFSTLTEYYTGVNPFQSPALFRKKREEQENSIRRLSFSREQEAQLLEVLDTPTYKVMNKPEIRIIYHMGMFTGQRLKDCVLLRWDRVDLTLKKIWVKQYKTGKEVTIPIAPRLLEVLKSAIEWRKDEYVCPNVAARYKKTDGNGKNTGNNLVNIDVLRVIKWIGLEPSIEMVGRKKKVTVYGFHSLRHTFASNCAMAGVPKAVVASILGADSEIIDQYYTHIGEEAQEKAIAAIAGGIGMKSDRERLEEIAIIINDSAITSDDKIDKIREVMKL